MSLPRPRPLALSLALCFAGSCVQAFAQQSGGQDAPAAASIARVEVKGTAADYDPRRDDTAARIVIGREEIARYGDTDVAEILRRLPGVTVTTGAGRALQVRMRGLGGGYTQLLVNGERAPAGFALDNLSPDLIERIEVLRVASAEFSAESVAGTINIVLRKAGRKPQREAKFGYLLSSDFRGPTFNLEFGERGERASYALSGSGNHDGLSRASGSTEENRRPDGSLDMLRTMRQTERGRMNRLNLGPRFSWTLENGDTLAWETLVTSSSFRNHGQARVSTALGLAPPLPDLDTYGEFDDRMLQSDVGWTTQLDSATKLEAKLGVEWSSRTVFIRRKGLDSAGLAATDGSVLSDGDARGAKSSGKATRSLADGHLLALGWNLGFEDSGDIRVERDRVRVFPSNQLLDERFDAQLRRTAVYAQDEWTVNPAWSLYLGARWEGVGTRVRGTGFAPTRVHSSVISPIVQSLWKFPGAREGQSEQLRLALSRTYKAPDLTSLVPRRAAWENNSATEADYVGNPALKPELAWGMDAAWEHYWAPGAMVSLAASWRRIDDYTSNRVYFDGLRWVYTPANADRATMRSVDLETKFPLKAWLRDAPAIDLRASVGRNWSRVASVPGPHNRMEQQTPLSASLGVDYKGSALGAGASVAYRRGGLVRVTANRGFEREARTDLEAYALWTFTPRLQLRTALSNLLEADDAYAISYDDPVRGRERRAWRYPGHAKLRTTLEMKF